VAAELYTIYASYSSIAAGACPPIFHPCALRLPNIYNFSYDFLSITYLFLALYIPGFPFLYSEMLAERKRRLGVAKLKTQ
jgi:hypothetical protein